MELKKTELATCPLTYAHYWVMQKQETKSLMEQAVTSQMTGCDAQRVDGWRRPETPACKGSQYPLLN